jgi:hypothetical protein
MIDSLNNALNLPQLRWQIWLSLPSFWRPIKKITNPSSLSSDHTNDRSHRVDENLSSVKTIRFSRFISFN